MERSLIEESIKHQQNYFKLPLTELSKSGGIIRIIMQTELSQITLILSKSSPNQASPILDYIKLLFRHATHLQYNLSHDLRVKNEKTLMNKFPTQDCRAIHQCCLRIKFVIRELKPAQLQKLELEVKEEEKRRQEAHKLLEDSQKTESQVASEEEPRTSTMFSKEEEKDLHGALTSGLSQKMKAKQTQFVKRF